VTDPTPPGPTGSLVIDKQPGFTSMDVCAIIRTRLRRAGAPKRIKVGHGGTLDPMATGVLVVLIGKATPLCNVIMAGEKEYAATIDLSKRSNTDDAEGAVEEVAIANVPTRTQLEQACVPFVGTIMQVPPAFSALSVGGRRAYEMARAGEHVELAARPVHIHSILLTAFEWPLVELHVVCGKGTYIRSLARDLGSNLGLGGMLTALRRTRVGRFDLSHAKRLDELANQLTQSDVDPIPPEFL